MDTAFLTKKYGPLPGWAYIGIAGIPIAYFVFKGKSGATASPTGAQPAGSNIPGYDPGPLSYGSTGGGGSGGGGNGQPFDPSGIIAAIQSGNEATLNAVSQQGLGFSSMFNNALGTLNQSITALANRPALTAPATYPGSSYSPPYVPPPVSAPQTQIQMPPSVPMYAPQAPAYVPPPPVYIAPQGPSYLPQGSFQNLGNNAYAPVNPGPLINNNYSDPRWMGTTVFNGNGQVWKGLVPQ